MTPYMETTKTCITLLALFLFQAIPMFKPSCREHSRPGRPRFPRPKPPKGTETPKEPTRVPKRRVPAFVGVDEYSWPPNELVES